MKKLYYVKAEKYFVNEHDYREIYAKNKLDAIIKYCKMFKKYNKSIKGEISFDHILIKEVK